MKATISLLVTLFLTMVATGVQAQTYFPPKCNSGTLKEQGNTNKFVCEVTSSTPASCQSGYVKKTNATAKDKCEKMVEDLKVPTCQLPVGGNQSNWEIKVKSGADHCEHKTKNKGVQPLKCTGGYSLAQDKSGNQDRCVKSVQEKKDATCPSGSNHKVAGADVCESTTYSKPTF